jgi:hypothetical protein
MTSSCNLLILARHTLSQKNIVGNHSSISFSSVREYIKSSSISPRYLHLKLVTASGDKTTLSHLEVFGAAAETSRLFAYLENGSINYTIIYVQVLRMGRFNCP